MRRFFVHSITFSVPVEDFGRQVISVLYHCDDQWQCQRQFDLKWPVENSKSPFPAIGAWDADVSQMGKRLRSLRSGRFF